MTKKNILVIEDNQELSESLFDMLELANYNPHITLTGRDGLKHALEHHPDLIILDIRLPDISGYDVYRKIREDSWGKNAKVLILTASESIENISKNVNLPREDVLFKPDCSVSDLIKKISKRLSA